MGIQDKLAEDSPTFPVVAFQVFALNVYDDFLELLKKADPDRAEAFPRNRDEVIAAKGVENLVQALRDIFEQDPAISVQMLEYLDNEMTSTVDRKKHQVLKSLIRMYSGGNSNYLNYYGPSTPFPIISSFRILRAIHSSLKWLI